MSEIDLLPNHITNFKANHGSLLTILTTWVYCNWYWNQSMLINLCITMYYEHSGTFLSKLFLGLYWNFLQLKLFERSSKFGEQPNLSHLKENLVWYQAPPKIETFKLSKFSISFWLLKYWFLMVFEFAQDWLWIFCLYIELVTQNFGTHLYYFPPI